MPHVKIIDVAREAGVSLGTVSNALNHPDKVRPETRARIEAAIERLGYLPNQNARLLAGGRNAVLGLVLSRLNDGISLQIASGARAEAHARGYGLLIADTEDDASLRRSYLRSLLGTQIAAVLMHPTAEDGWIPPTETALVPSVFLDARTDATGFFVVADNRSQGRIIAEHARAVGAHRVAVIGRAAVRQLSLRVSGIRNALAMQRDIELEILDAGDGDVSGDGYSLGLELIKRDEANRPDFIIGITDVLAAGALAAAVEAGLTVPDEVSIAGCDGNPLAWNGMLPLTTCAPIGYEMGRKAVRIAIGRIELASDSGSAPRRADATRDLPAGTGDSSACAHTEEVVKPFLLARATTRRPPHEDLAPNGRRASSSPIPEFDIGAYL